MPLEIDLDPTYQWMKMKGETLSGAGPTLVTLVLCWATYERSALQEVSTETSIVCIIRVLLFRKFVDCKNGLLVLNVLVKYNSHGTSDNSNEKVN